MRREDKASDDTKACAQQLQQAAFKGDFRMFDRALSDYRQRHFDDDPHARAVFEILLSSPGSQLLAWRSRSTSITEFHEQRRRRWDAWLAVLPLDLQLHLVHMEAEPLTLECIDLGAIKWDQWNALRQAGEQQRALEQSPLWPRKLGWKTWEAANDGLSQVCRDIAGQLAAWKQYEAMSDWMGKANIDPGQAIEALYVHYQVPGMRGSTFATAQPPLPFWAIGLYVGASEDAYWETMAGRGGPRAPLADQVDLVAPLARIKPQALLASEAIAQVERTAAQWQQRILDTNTPEAAARRATPRL